MPERNRLENTLPRVFVGSSSESLNIAQAIRAKLESVADARLWNEGLFAPSSYALDELMRFTRQFDFAVFVFSADDSVSSRDEESHAPRDNGVLEAGMFYASLGRERVFICEPDAPRNQEAE